MEYKTQKAAEVEPGIEIEYRDSRGQYQRGKVSSIELDGTAIYLKIQCTGCALAVLKDTLFRLSNELLSNYVKKLACIPGAIGSNEYGEDPKEGQQLKPLI
jgi:hypothetical protein